MWKIGTPVAIVSTDVAQQLTTSTGLVKAIRIFQYWNNGFKIYWGDITLNTAAVPPTGVGGWVPPPVATAGGSDTVTEVDAINGINANQIYVAGTAGDYVLWSYIEQ